jgi:glycosyltransferase involved in cell wall biosynthesis
VAFFVEFPDAKFLGDIFRHVGGRFEVRLAQPRQARDLADLLAWCDIAWFEWCTSQVVVASRLPKTCRTIVRLHRFEAYGPWPEQVRWENVDALLTVGNPATLDHLKARVPDLDRRTRVLQVPNGVDLERFAFADRPRGKHLAWVGNLNEHKNPMLALQGLASLRAADPEYRLFFAGEFQDTGYLRQYMSEMVGDLGLSGAVQFDGWQKDVAAWLRDKHYLVTSSIVEGHPVGALEAMACGLKPVIHAFPGCRAFFPDEFLYRTVDEFCERILRGPYEPRAYRDWVAGRFPLKAQLDRIGALLLEFERCPAPRPTAREARAASAVDAFLEEVAAHGAAAT